MANTNNDIFGREIKEGDYIARPYALGRSSCLSISKVLRTDEKGLRVSNVRHEEWRTPGTWARIANGTIKYPGRCLLVSPETLPEEVLELLNSEYPEKKKV